MGRIIVPDGTGGYAFPNEDIVAWAVETNRAQDLPPEFDPNLHSVDFLTTELQARGLRRSLLLPCSFRWTQGSRKGTTTFFLITQRPFQGDIDFQPVKGRNEAAADSWLEGLGYKGRKEWVVIGDDCRIRFG